MTTEMVLGLATFLGVCGVLVTVIALINRWAKKKYGDRK